MRDLFKFLRNFDEIFSVKLIEVSDQLDADHSRFAPIIKKLGQCHKLEKLSILPIREPEIFYDLT